MTASGVEPEYLALVSPDTFTAVDRGDGDDVLVAVAAHIGDVRLIDNDLLTAASEDGRADTSTGSH
jgi:pantoate--beta-alanine ligase